MGFALITMIVVTWINAFDIKEKNYTLGYENENRCIFPRCMF